MNTLLYGHSYSIGYFQVDDIKSVLEAVGAEAEDEQIEKLLANVESKNLEELLKEGSERLVSMPAGGAAAPAASGAAAAEEKKEEEKKEEEEEEEEDVDMSGGGLFGDDDDDW